MSFSPFCPTDIRVLPKADGEAALRSLLSGKNHRLLVLVPHLLYAELRLSSLFSALEGEGHRLHLVTEIPSNPSVDDLASLLARLREQPFDPTCLLAIGGGSCIDLAKGVSALWALPEGAAPSGAAIRGAILEKRYPHSPFLDLIAMPTTAGTGSEVTHWATIWDTHEKLSIDCVSCFPKAAILIPEWTAGMPQALTLSTGLDALSHAMEAFWARARTPLSQALALSAVNRVRRFLPLALQKPRDIKIRQEMSMASLLAGLAFSQTRTTACHSLSYPLTLLHGLPHGFAASVTLPAVMCRNRALVPEIQQMEALFISDGGFENWLQETCGDVQPLRLSAFGLFEENLLPIAETAFTKGRMDNNPIAFTPEECLMILRESL